MRVEAYQFLDLVAALAAVRPEEARLEVLEECLHDLALNQID
jgi:hypothetical protein